MHDVESRSIRRAAVLLLVVSAARYAVVEVGPSGRAGQSGLAVSLAATSRLGAEEADERARPLGAEERIDPNRADAAQLDRLPGVGPSTAEAVVQARDSGIVFRTAEDLLMVRGIGPATLVRIEPHLDLSVPASGSRARARTELAAVDVNRADLSTLEGLPGIGPELARRIVEEREVRPFASIDELARVRGIGAATVARLREHAVASARR